MKVFRLCVYVCCLLYRAFSRTMTAQSGLGFWTRAARKKAGRCWLSTTSSWWPWNRNRRGGRTGVRGLPERKSLPSTNTDCWFELDLIKSLLVQIANCCHSGEGWRGWICCRYSGGRRQERVIHLLYRVDIILRLSLDVFLITISPVFDFDPWHPLAERKRKNGNPNTNATHALRRFAFRRSIDTKTAGVVTPKSCDGCNDAADSVEFPKRRAASEGYAHTSRE